MKRTFAVLVVLALAVLLHAQTSSEHISLDKERIVPGDEIVIHYEGMPGNAQDWIALVPATAAENTYGQWFYTRGRSSGTHSFKGVRVGAYEIRVYYDWPAGGFEVRDRLRFDVVGRDESDAPFVPAAQTPGTWRGPETQRVPAASEWRARGADPSVEQKALDRLHSIVDLIRATDSIGQPVGFESWSGLSVELGVPQWMGALPSPQPGPALSWARVTLYPYYQARDGSVHTDKPFGYVRVTENDPTPLYFWGGGCRSLEGEWWYLEPKAIGTAGRFTIYEMIGDSRGGPSGDQRAVILTSSGLPQPWLPVTMGEFLEDRVQRMELRLAEARQGLERHAAFRRNLEKQLEEMRETYESLKERSPKEAEAYAQAIEVLEAAWFSDDPKAREEEARMIEAAEQLHAEMAQDIAESRSIMDRASPAELAAQATGSANFRLPAERHQVIITPPGVPGGSEIRGIVRPNPAVLSKEYAPESVRMMTVHYYSTGWPILRDALDRFIEELDWDALGALLD